MRTVAVLCCAKKSVYHSMDGVECFDSSRNALNFPGGMPIVAHPPCRSWSAFCKHQAKPESGEKELGIWCAEQLRKCGGVLEQPAHSGLFSAAGLPLPGKIEGDLWSLEVWQRWWGYTTKKNTWLCFCGVEPSRIYTPFQLHSGGRDRRLMQLMSHNQRSATCSNFAEWIVDAARQSNLSLDIFPPVGVDCRP